jgi:hypothetical protein
LDAWLLAAGLSTAAGLGVIEIVLSRTGDRIGLTPLGIVILVFFIAIILARRNATSRKSAETLAELAGAVLAGSCPWNSCNTLGHEHYNDEIGGCGHTR